MLVLCKFIRQLISFSAFAIICQLGRFSVSLSHAKLIIIIPYYELGQQGTWNKIIKAKRSKIGECIRQLTRNESFDFITRDRSGDGPLLNASSIAWTLLGTQYPASASNVCIVWVTDLPSDPQKTFDCRQYSCNVCSSSRPCHLRPILSRSWVRSQLQSRQVLWVALFSVRPQTWRLPVVSVDHLSTVSLQL